EICIWLISAAQFQHCQLVALVVAGVRVFGNSFINILSDGIIDNVRFVVAQNSKAADIQLVIHSITEVSRNKFRINTFCSIVLRNCKPKVAIANPKTGSTTSIEVFKTTRKVEIIP